MGERRRRATAVAGGDGRAEEKAAAPAPTVWFALKKSLQCRSQSSEVHVPKPKASATSGAGGGLSSIVTKRAARSGCSRSIANLRDVIHGSKRHPGQPPSCSPRSIGSSEFLNPIAHEVVLSTNSRCELKITGFGGGLGAAGGGGGPAHDAEGGGDGGGVVSSFVGTLRPGTPGPGWSHGLQYSGSCRAGSMRCTPPRSPNPLLDRDGAAATTATAHRASCEVDAAKTGGGKGSGGLSCHRCAEQFGKWEALEAHHLSKHAVTELVEGDSSRKIVEIICRTSLLKSESSCVRIERVFKVHNTQRTLARFEEYREAVKLKASKLAKKHPRCLADGNELLRFHGATLACALGSAGASSLCASDKCAVCRIIRHGFSSSSSSNSSSKKDGKAGVGVFTTSTSGRAFESADQQDDPAARRALLVCRVIAGRVHKPLENVREFVGQAGFDSLAGKVGPYANIEELYLLNPRALLPCFVVICKP
ncbi:hypothetical protein CFC21_036539 [Triticum aestivum]|uniref:C2H2-type domain-containing protein n=3 Tax=Triticum TaxID=4564 RepID=A0A9R0RQF0_TRITD|nr:uncharacterized protein LOC123062275 isoform X2 [Triticum aestivum]KAF7024155.1 hypothetical protein CFC21_036539 [Triticum aestivum]VAH64883.1 unnamed protein product [Triticum turgidum subsp. durum]